MLRFLVTLSLACAASGANLESRPAVAARPVLGRAVEKGHSVVAASSNPAPVAKRRTEVFAAASGGFDYSLMLYFVFWYIGNAIYNMYNTMALKAVGGKYSGMTMTVSTLQLGICTLYAGLLWLTNFNPIRLLGLEKPGKMPLPQTTKEDLINTLPVGFCAAAAHSAGVFCLGADPLFGQIVKAGEPVLSAFVNTVFYGKPPSLAKVVCLFFIVCGVAFSSLKKNLETGVYKLKFDERALIFGMIGNSFAAFKGSENKKLMDDKDLKSRFGGVGNQFAVTEVLAFIWSLPVMFAVEGDKFSEFVNLFMTNKACMFNVTASGLTFYLYNELATMTVKAVGPVGSSVANTAKRVIVMLYMAAVTGKALTEEQQIGAAVAIGGVMLYSVIDNIFAGKSKKN